MSPRLFRLICPHNYVVLGYYSVTGTARKRDPFRDRFTIVIAGRMIEASSSRRSHEGPSDFPFAISSDTRSFEIHIITRVLTCCSQSIASGSSCSGNPRRFVDRLARRHPRSVVRSSARNFSRATASETRWPPRY